VNHLVRERSGLRGNHLEHRTAGYSNGKISKNIATSDALAHGRASQQSENGFNTERTEKTKRTTGRAEPCAWFRANKSSLLLIADNAFPSGILKVAFPRLVEQIV
jgi:hypothetical protein